MLPVHYEVTPSQRLFSIVSIVTAALLLTALGWRLIVQIDLLRWWVPVALLAGIALADFASGLVHWGADTWGRDDLPLIGQRLLVPFRVHHVNPDDLLRRSFLDANGDVAFIGVPVLLALHAIPLDARWGGPAAIFGFAFCGVGVLTNQIHQWAHMASPPRVIRWLQHGRLFLRNREHATHHRRPYDAHYCITTGWCNAPLDAVGFFRRLERLITRLTGVRPRDDDDRYEQRYASTAGTSQDAA